MEHTEAIELTREEAEIINKLRSLKKYGKEGMKSYNYLIGFIPGAVDKLIQLSMEEEQKGKIINFETRKVKR